MFNVNVENFYFSFFFCFMKMFWIKILLHLLSAGMIQRTQCLDDDFVCLGDSKRLENWFAFFAVSIAKICIVMMSVVIQGHNQPKKIHFSFTSMFFWISSHDKHGLWPFLIALNCILIETVFSILFVICFGSFLL